MAHFRHNKGIIRFGVRLKFLRNKKGLTQKELAFLCDVEISQISRIERGVINTTLSFILLLSEKMDINPEEFFK